MIYIYGDRHAEFNFKRLNLPHINFSRANITMFRVGRDNSIINFNSDMHNKESIICICYGEIDCRCHIQREIDLGKNENDVISELVSNYFTTLKNNVKEHKKIIIVGIIPPTLQNDYEQLHGPIMHEYQFVGSNENRVRYTEKMNYLIEKSCNINGYIYFNPFFYYTRPNGTLKHELSDTMVHLGENSFFLENFLELHDKITMFDNCDPKTNGEEKKLEKHDKISMFNNCDQKTNGEEKFFIDIKDKINIIFDVGCRMDSEFSYFNGEVHYFDPINEFIEGLKKQENLNKISYFNNFGLGNENKQLYYYPKYESFYDRINSCRYSDASNKILLYIKKGKDYAINKNIKNIDFLKIDTEGYELNVLQGFEDFLENIKIIQFEYGGTFLDNNTKLIEVIRYLEQKGFYKFSYLTNIGTKLITDFSDHYQYCNIVCINKNSNFIPF